MCESHTSNQYDKSPRISLESFSRVYTKFFAIYKIKMRVATKRILFFPQFARCYVGDFRKKMNTAVTQNGRMDRRMQVCTREKDGGVKGKGKGERKNERKRGRE